MTEEQYTLEDQEDEGRLFGPADQHLRLIRDRLGVQLAARKGVVRVQGEKESVRRALKTLRRSEEFLKKTGSLGQDDVRHIMDRIEEDAPPHKIETIPLLDRGRAVVPKTEGQLRYIEAIRAHDIVFSIGPAGTGKTYLAVAMALNALGKQEVRKIILARPAVEAGEKLGFLPGTLQEKVNPYVRPLYDAMEDLVDVKRTTQMIDSGILEVVPIAYMRGRTLDRCFVILDEAQNCTIGQMKMFLTRLGLHSKAVITGDITQVDLPEGEFSGLRDAFQLLSKIPGIAFVRLHNSDIVRHPLVRKIIQAYDERSQLEETS